MDVRIGTAGWSIPLAAASGFDSSGTHLERYSRRLDCAEINSSFYRPHAATTYAKWRDSTPPGFLFAVKIPRLITHELKLQDAQEPFITFLAQTDGLVDKRGPLLVQLPPSLSFSGPVVTTFLDGVRRVYSGPVVCEPRHATWFSPVAASLLERYKISRVAADPPPVPDATVPAGWPRVAYFRLHGSPRTYWSRYDESAIQTIAATISRISTAEQVWCVFDNTASGAAIANACELRERLIVDPSCRGTEDPNGTGEMLERRPCTRNGRARRHESSMEDVHAIQEPSAAKKVCTAPGGREDLERDV